MSRTGSGLATRRTLLRFDLCVEKPCTDPILQGGSCTWFSLEGGKERGLDLFKCTTFSHFTHVPHNRKQNKGAEPLLNNSCTQGKQCMNTQWPEEAGLQDMDVWYCSSHAHNVFIADQVCTLQSCPKTHTCLMSTSA